MIASSALKTRTPRALSAEQVAAYRRDGFLFLPGLFAAEEIEPLRRACLTDPSANGGTYALSDSAGNPQEVVVWTDLGSGLLGVMPRLARVVERIADLVGAEIYHWHSKLSLKRPGSSGRWDWHQDYAYWYHDGVLAPDMATITIAVDPTDRANGCLQLVKGSHALGRIDHPPVGNATAVDPARLELIQQRMETVPCVMAPGDAVIFHCNTLHASGPNPSGRPRTLLHCSYNAVGNEPFIEGQEHHGYKPLAVLRDAALRDGYSSVLGDQPFLSPFSDAIGTYGYKVSQAPAAPL